MPGVAGTDMHYLSDFENGQNFRLTVRLDAHVSEQQAASVGSGFVDQMQRHHLGSHRVELDLNYPATPRVKSSYLPDYSQATFKLGDNASPPMDLTGSDVGASTAAWLRAVRSPIAEYASLTQPAWGGPATSRDIEITLKPDATSASATALQHSDPALSVATWRVMVVTEQSYRPQEYTSKPNPPSDRDMALWRQITDVVGLRTDASGSTQISVEHSQAETQIDAGLPSGPDARTTAFSVADLARQFDHPVQLTLRTGDGPVEVIVGGCERHDAGHRRLPLEIEMSHIYEKC